MKTKNLVMAAVLLAMGTVLHYVVPGVVNGIKPDFLLATMFMAIVLCKDLKSTVAIGLAAGILAAITTSFPGGQIPSLLDKMISALAFYSLYFVVEKKIQGGIMFSIMTAIGTLISGFVFLGSALVLAGGLPGGAGIGAMMMAIVIPTAIANIAFGFLLYKSYQGYRKAVTA